MAVLVDEAIWPWRGMRWAHLVSDTDLDELHDLAHRLGMPYLSFQGDHYDVHEELRRRAIELGARPTPARDLVRALRAAGLRHREHLPAWEWGGRWSPPASPAEEPVPSRPDDSRPTSERQSLGIERLSQRGRTEPHPGREPAGGPPERVLSLRLGTSSPMGAFHAIGAPLDAVNPEELLEFARGVHEVTARAEAYEVGWAHRPGELLLVASIPEVRRTSASGLRRVDTGVSLHRTAGERGTYVELVVRRPPA